MIELSLPSRVSTIPLSCSAPLAAPVLTLTFVPLPVLVAPPLTPLLVLPPPVTGSVVVDLFVLVGTLLLVKSAGALEPQLPTVPSVELPLPPQAAGVSELPVPDDGMTVIPEPTGPARVSPVQVFPIVVLPGRVLSW